jgi:hypothetical protein
MKPRLLAAALALLIGLPVGSQADELVLCSPPAESILKVSLHPQHAENWCWAASLQMILEYLGQPSNNVEQCVQANVKFSRNDCCPPNNQSIPLECDRTAWPAFENYSNQNGVKFQYKVTSNAPLDKDVLEKQLAPRSADHVCSFTPFAFTWKYVGTGGHMMVATGYRKIGDQFFVEVNDPKEVDQGSTRELTYDQYVSSAKYTHWNDYYDIK